MTFLEDIYGPNPPIGGLPNGARLSVGETLERLPVQYEVSISIAPPVGASFYIKAYGALQEDAEAIAQFARTLSEAYLLAGGGE